MIILKTSPPLRRIWWSLLRCCRNKNAWNFRYPANGWKSSRACSWKPYRAIMYESYSRFCHRIDYFQSPRIFGFGPDGYLPYRQYNPVKMRGIYDMSLCMNLLEVDGRCVKLMRMDTATTFPYQNQFHLFLEDPVPVLFPKTGYRVLLFCCDFLKSTNRWIFIRVRKTLLHIWLWDFGLRYRRTWIWFCS